MVSDEPFPNRSSPCRATVHKWGLAQSPSCDCGQQQTVNHIVDRYPLTTFEGGLNLLHKAADDAVIWLDSTLTAALAKKINAVTLLARLQDGLLLSSVRSMDQYVDATTRYYYYIASAGNSGEGS